MSQNIKCVGGALLLSLALNTFAQTPEDAGNFDQCLNTLVATAKENNISKDTIENTLAKVKYSARVIELDRQQPEFTTSFADYLNRRVTQDRVDKGRALLQKHQALLEQISKEYGVPSQYLVAFWGLETNYGSFFGKMSVLDSLATLACDTRRGDYFTGELISALKIVDEGAISPEKMEGSWAGAMGHVQFMPSAFLRHAVDYDGDGKRDLWNSIPDAMASAANFLRSLGWEKGSRWGREVSLPTNFNFLEAGLNQQRTLTEWRNAGVKQARGDVLSAADDLTASLLVPAGYQGPAFLVYDNFRVIMKWNRSEYYAIAVGHLADRITGGGKLIQQPPTDAPRLSRQQVLDLQIKLAQADIDVGEPDGIFGPATRRALGEYQQKNGMIADGFADANTLKKLGIGLQ